jgi:branched-subunit amino acid aminotransferase/4-amino-4-deoxychorismate lyase
MKLDKKGKGNSLYIRPFMIATGEGVIANPSNDYKFMIILSPAKSVLFWGKSIDRRAFQ